MLWLLFQYDGKKREFEKNEATNTLSPEIPGRPQPPTQAELNIMLEKVHAYRPTENSEFVLNRSGELALSVFSLMLQKTDHEGTFSFIYIFLMFLVSITRVHILNSRSMRYYAKSLFHRVPWQELSSFMNSVVSSSPGLDVVKIYSAHFLPDDGGQDEYILPEDRIMIGQIFSPSLYGDKWFHRVLLGDKPVTELPSASKIRRERMVHATVYFAKVGDMIALGPMK